MDIDKNIVKCNEKERNEKIEKCQKMQIKN